MAGGRQVWDEELEDLVLVRMEKGSSDIGCSSKAYSIASVRKAGINSSGLSQPLEKLDLQ